MIAHGDPFCDELILTANDWSAVDRVELFLRKPARLSTRIGSSSVGSISLAHNATKSMVDHCNTYMSDASSVIAWAAEGMLATLVSKSQLFNSNPAVVARFLDIRCARDVLSDEYRCDEPMVLQLLSSHRYQTPSEATTVSFVQPDVECGSVWSEDDDLFGGRPTAPVVAPDSETKRFALEPQANKQLDIVAWWISHRMEYPRLSLLAMDYLSIPATSAPSERANSITKTVFSGRDCLSDEMFKIQMCCKSWLAFAQAIGHKLPLDYLQSYNELKSSWTTDGFQDGDPTVAYAIHYLNANRKLSDSE